MKVLIAGDYVARNRLEPLVENRDFEAIFGEVKEIVTSADYSLVNFESPIFEDGDMAIPKCGPNLRCANCAVDAIKYAGFRCATLANNHIRDWGDSAVVRTMKVLKEHDLDYVGVGKDLDEAASILYRQLNEKTLAVINCCENEFSIASKDHYGANPLNPVKQYYSIQKAKKKADYVMVIVHGGHEHHQLPSPRMQDTYRFFIDAGADIVVNHHQHCYSGYEIYKGKPIVYGTGNFCMDKVPVLTRQIWNYGYMAIWDTDSPDSIKIKPYEQCGENPSVHLLPDDAFDDNLKRLNLVIANREMLETKTTEYYQLEAKRIRNVLEPIQNRFIAGLQRRGLLPSLLTNKWLLKLQDFILCESHRDKLEYFFKKNKNE